MDTMRTIALALVTLLLLAGCGDTEGPRTEAEADGGCWSPPKCSEAPTFASGTTECQGIAVHGYGCAQSEQMVTCWWPIDPGYAIPIVYGASSCEECHILSHCP